MNIFFLRHTSLDVEPDVFYGQTDLDVSNTFEEEVKIIKKKINKLITKDYKVKVYSSPLQRCRKLSQKISDNVILDPRIMELNLGDWEMKPKQSIPKELVENWEKDMINFTIPNGESNKKFLQRLKEFTDEICKTDEDVLIVAHAGSINGMISNLTGEPFDKLLKNFWEKISYGSLSLLKKESKQFIIKFIGR
jgi:alpha-ribazole phosphatase